MTFEQNDVLFGHDPETGIVAVECDAEGATLYVREADGSTQTRRERFTPFLWTDSEVASEEIATRPLAGELTFRCIAECPGGWRQFSRLRTSLKNTGVKSFSLGDPVQQFLLQTGKTLFKGLEFEQLRRMQLAIETHRVDPDGVACAETPADYLLSITMSDASGWEQLLMIEPANPELSELAALEELTRTIAERDPDVIEGHDLFRVALPYLTARAKLRQTKLTWGRDQSVPRSRASRLQIAEKTINYPKFEVAGRHFVDTFLLAQFYDVSARELEAFELADVAGHFHFSSEGQIATARGRQDAHLNEPENFATHARRTVAQIREVATTLSASYFVQAKIFPYNYQDVVIRGNATKIDALLLREYYRRGHSIPDLPQARVFEGGYTDIFFSGIAHAVAHCDVASLYPSVMLRFDCFPAQDQLGIFRGLLTDLRTFRLEAKARLRDAPGAERQHLNALQSTFKILINSFYGYLGFAQAHFADFDAAARVTEIGRDLLKKMVAWLEAQGAQVIEIDTDGIYFVPKDPAADLQAGLKTVLPEGIEVEFDARYPAMFSYKAKNYALLTETGDLLIKGGALKSRGLEKFQRLFLERMIRLLLEDKAGEIPALRTEFEQKIREREFPIELLMKTDTLQDSLGQYARKIQGAARNRASAYELALKSGRNFQPGDQVSYYVTGTKKTVAVYENSKLASEWNPAVRDENVEYYAAKLKDLVKKFAFFCETDNPAQIELI